MSLPKYLLVRFLNAVIVLTVVLIITSMIFNKAAEAQLKSQIEEEIAIKFSTNRELAKSLAGNLTALRNWQENIRKAKYKQYGLDKPFIVRVLMRLRQQLAFDWGKAHYLHSSTGEKSVSEIISEALPRTTLLFVTGTILVILIGTPIGLRAAYLSRKLDNFITSWALLSNSLPVWWIGMLLIFLFSYMLGILPSGGFVSIPPPSKTFLRVVDVMYHLILPVSAQILVTFGSWAYIVRNVVTSQLQEDFVFLARAKGLSEDRILKKHILKASGPPIVTMAGMSLLSALGGSLTCEIVFRWPGLGMLFWEALRKNDVPVLLGLSTASTMLFLACMIVLDVAYVLIDPRVRIGAMSRLKE
ncbi:MAG: ABC transporter permease [Thermoproteota archaeon]|nr:MAG: ABC transporter permease [Candidatus Korarchaeota archaeon]